MAEVGRDPRIHRIERDIRPSEVLAVQSGVIANARVFVGSFGAMSYLGQALARTVIAVKAGDGVIGSGERELAQVPPDPAAGPIHLVELEQLATLIPALAADAPPGAPALEGLLAAAALSSSPAPAKSRSKAPAGAVDG
jgi:hypothetical protein